MASIGSMVVNLSANTGKLRTGLKSASGMVGGFAKKVRGAMGGIGGLLGGLAIAATARSALDAAKTQIAAEAKLGAVLKATGGAAGLSAKEISTYANELAGVTNFGDEATVNAAAMLATFKEIKGDMFKDALSTAQDMASVLDGDMKGSVIQLGKALNDPTKGMAALADSGVSFTASQIEQVKALQASGDMLGAQKIIMAELQSEFGGAAEAMADPFTQMGNAVGDVMEKIGGLIMDLGSRLLPYVLTATTFIQDNFDAAVAWIGDVWNSTVDAMAVGITATMAVGEWALTNWQAIAEISFKTAALAAVSFGNDVAHFFTGVLPALFSWFTSNWSDIWSTSVNYVATIFLNLADNIQNIFSAVWDYITGESENLEFNTKPLTEGFYNSISELPDIPERAIGELEQVLQTDVAKLGESLGNSFDATVTDRLANLREMQAEKNAATEGPTAPTAPGIPTGPTAPTGGGGSGGGGQSQQAKSAGFAAAGSAEAFKILAEAGRKSPELAEAKKQTKAIEEIANNTNPRTGGGNPVVQLVAGGAQ